MYSKRLRELIYEYYNEDDVEISVNDTEVVLQFDTEYINHPDVEIVMAGCMYIADYFGALLDSQVQGHWTYYEVAFDLLNNDGQIILDVSHINSPVSEPLIPLEFDRDGEWSETMTEDALGRRRKLSDAQKKANSFIMKQIAKRAAKESLNKICGEI